MTGRPKSKSGAALIESCLVIIMLCLILFGILQISYVIASRNVLDYAAFATARAAAVGLNDFMLLKVSRYASIPTAGPIKTPSNLGHPKLIGNTMGGRIDYALRRKNTPESGQGWYEVASKQDFHLADENEYLAILDYDNWSGSGGAKVVANVDYDSDLVSVVIRQNLPLTFPFAKAFSRHLWKQGSVISVPRTIPKKDKVTGAWRDEETTLEYPALPIETQEAVMENHALLYLQTSP